MKRILNLALILMVLAACTATRGQPAATPAPANTPGAYLPNPASVYCEQNGYTLEIRSAADGSQGGVCIFPDGVECGEWAYYRGECKPGSAAQPSATLGDKDPGWLVYRNESLGYRFLYPAGAEIIVSDEPKKSLHISGAGMGNEFWGLSHPADLAEYRIPQGVDLLQWLTGQHLTGEKRMADVQIAGTTAIHYRHERSRQSYADDRYFFARDGQLYMILIGHSSEIEDWELDNRFLQSFQFDGSPTNPPIPTAIPTVLPLDPAGYQGWWTYTHPVYNFSIMLPEEWAVQETTIADPLMNGHLLMLQPRVTAGPDLSIRMTFRQAGEDILLWPTGVGAGELIPQGTLEIAGQPARRILFVCPTGQINAVRYHGAAEAEPNIRRGNMEFGFIVTQTGAYCQEGFSLGGKVLLVGEMVIASLRVR